MLTYGLPPEFRGGAHLFIPPYAIGSVPSLSGHAIAYRWRPLPRVRRHRASKPQDSSERVLPWQVTMDQLIYASHSHTHYWYALGMLKVPDTYIYTYIPDCQSGTWSAGQENIRGTSTKLQREYKKQKNRQKRHKNRKQKLQKENARKDR